MCYDSKPYQSHLRAGWQYFAVPGNKTLFWVKPSRRDALGERTVGDDGEVILGPAVIVTPANVNSFAF